MNTAKLEKWVVYSWVKTSKIPGGRKRLVETEVYATSRQTAKDAFLVCHPEELRSQIGASRIKTEKSKNTMTHSNEDIATVSAEVTLDEVTDEHVMQPPKQKRNHVNKNQRYSAMSNINSHPLWAEIQALMDVVIDRNETDGARHRAYARVVGIAKIDPDSSVSMYIANRMNELRGALEMQTGSGQEKQKESIT